MSNLLSAKIQSPGSRFDNNPQCSVKCLSLTLPPQAFEVNDIVPWGLIPIKNLWFCGVYIVTKL